MRGIITGSSSGIGKAIKEHLKQLNFEIIELKSRLENSKKLEQEIKSLQGKIDFLINAAGIGIFEPMQTISIEKIEKLIAINLTAPIILSKLLLPKLKKTQGVIINITSIEALRASKYSALYSASKAGLYHFSKCLFEEVRKDGIKVVTINPDLTNTPFFEKNSLQFKPKQGEEFSINPNEIAKLTEVILTSQAVITDITLRPQKVGIIKTMKH